jgi:hypothetical protein
MIQRFLFTALKLGVEEIQNDPSILEYLFEDHFSLSETERLIIQQVFEETPPKVFHGYLPKDAEVPAYSITLVREGETEHLIGDDAGMVTDQSDPDFGADCYSAIWEHSYNVHCYSQHPDVTSYIYEAAKSIILAQDQVFVGEGLFEIHVSGMDLAPDPRYIPEHLFVRQLTFSCQREFQRVDRAARLRKAFAVRGIHIDSAGSPSDVGGVKTLITPYGDTDG